MSTLNDSGRPASSVWSPRHHIQALRFTGELKRTILLLENPKEAAALLAHLPPCKTIAELVHHMRENGLRFAPASAGSERHYVSLHAAMADDARMVQP